MPETSFKPLLGKYLYVVYSAIFLATSYFQFRNSPPDSFVLFTISLIFAIAAFKMFRGNAHGEVYALSASVIAVVFAALSLLSALSSAMVLLISHKPVVLAFESQLGVVGFLTFPLLIYRTLKKLEPSERKNKKV